MNAFSDFIFDNFYLIAGAIAAIMLVMMVLRTLAATLFGLQHLEFVPLAVRTAVDISKDREAAEEEKQLRRILLIDYSWAELDALKKELGDEVHCFDLSLQRDALVDRSWPGAERRGGASVGAPAEASLGSLLTAGLQSILAAGPPPPVGSAAAGGDPSGRTAAPKAWIITGLESILMNRELRLGCLDMLEQLVFKDAATIYFFSEVSPLARLRQAREREKYDARQAEERGEHGEGGSQARERESFRWSNLFADFTTFYGAPPPAPTTGAWQAKDCVDKLLNKEFAEIRSTKVYRQRAAARKEAAAKGRDFSSEAVIAYLANFLGDYYQRQWLKSSREEHLAMHHLAHGRYINADNFVVLDNLLLRGLVRRDPDFRLMNDSFAYWIRMLEHPEWFEKFRQSAERGGAWHFMRVPLLLAIVTSVILLAYLDRGGSGSLLALLPAVAAGVPLLLTQFSQARQNIPG